VVLSGLGLGDAQLSGLGLGEVVLSRLGLGLGDEVLSGLGLGLGLGEVLLSGLGLGLGQVLLAGVGLMEVMFADVGGGEADGYGEGLGEEQLLLQLAVWTVLLLAAQALPPGSAAWLMV